MGGYIQQQILRFLRRTEAAVLATLGIWIAWGAGL